MPTATAAASSTVRKACNESTSLQYAVDHVVCIAEESPLALLNPTGEPTEVLTGIADLVGGLLWQAVQHERDDGDGGPSGVLAPTG
ncbi:hypothetical protein CC117_28505 [Parafrankia colletiae]|uniref:Uncharacterized protein n=1 Tax=Parafrankia colletiae TaxID=573497 RepID=A0A1S1Q740_9ACTN|nr:hypothetical protein CC117_28505 [Parafrankia colletiae]